MSTNDTLVKFASVQKTYDGSALVVRDLSPVVSSWRAAGDLGGWLQAHGVPGITGVSRANPSPKRHRTNATLAWCFKTTRCFRT